MLDLQTSCAIACFTVNDLVKFKCTIIDIKAFGFWIHCLDRGIIAWTLGVSNGKVEVLFVWVVVIGKEKMGALVVQVWVENNGKFEY